MVGDEKVITKFGMSSTSDYPALAQSALAVLVLPPTTTIYLSTFPGGKRNIFKSKWIPRLLPSSTLTSRTSSNLSRQYVKSWKGMRIRMVVSYFYVLDSLARHALLQNSAKHR